MTKPKQETSSGKFEQSQALHQRAKKVMPGGVGGQSQYRPPHPIYIARGRGPYLYDRDGNEYVDFMIGAGSLIHGHAHPAITRAVREALEEGVPNLSVTERLIELVERLVRYVPSMEKIRFVPSGSEAVQSVVRLARAFTGRDVVAKFEGAYHGSGENMLISCTANKALRGPQQAPHAIPYHTRTPEDVLKLTLILPFNDIEASVALIEKHARELALVMAEPVLGFGGAIPAEREYLAAIREVTRKHGILLAFDEVITGFRSRMGGIQDDYGVRPDLTTLGKVVAGGYPMAVFGGRSDVMELLSSESHPEDYIFQSGTFSAFPLSVAAGLASLKVMEDSAVFSHMNELGDRMRHGLKQAADAAGHPMQVTGVGSIFHTHFTKEPVRSIRQAEDADQELLRELHMRLLAHGIYLYQGHVGFISSAHREADIDRAIDAAAEVMRTIKR
ncbi:MAG TPA: aspartate aminotransferase family protein [Candidatus Binataceae bacterium]|nr:aspartate aminotransferase family protein [Candidatus Binataceae bacterium]